MEISNKVKESLKDRIDRLSGEGKQVEIKHLRDVVFNPELGIDVLSPKGGRTVAVVKWTTTLDEEHESTAVDVEHEIRGEAVCSKKDNYNRKIGAQKALGRAISKIGP